jgi:hypothetical protein
MNGKLLKTTSSKNIKIDDLPVGVYLLQIKTNEGFGYKRFVKE